MVRPQLASSTDHIANAVIVIAAFLRVVGDSFSTYSVSNPDPQSEERILTQLAPDLSTDLLKSLIGAFADLRTAFEVSYFPRADRPFRHGLTYLVNRPVLSPIHSLYENCSL